MKWYSEKISKRKTLSHLPVSKTCCRKKGGDKQYEKQLEEERAMARSLQLKQASGDYFIRVVRDRQDP
jgi:hypothetical protein